jgi:hypothetical protein
MNHEELHGQGGKGEKRPIVLLVTAVLAILALILVGSLFFIRPETSRLCLGPDSDQDLLGFDISADGRRLCRPRQLEPYVNWSRGRQGCLTPCEPLAYLWHHQTGFRRNHARQTELLKDGGGPNSEEELGNGRNEAPVRLLPRQRWSRASGFVHGLHARVCAEFGATRSKTSSKDSWGL